MSLSLTPRYTFSATLLGGAKSALLSLTDAAPLPVVMSMRQVFKGDKGDPGEYDGAVAAASPDPVLLFENALL